MNALIPCGHCYNCDEEIPLNLLFCNSACHDDWTRMEEAEDVYEADPIADITGQVED